MYRRIFSITSPTKSADGPAKGIFSTYEIGLPEFFSVRMERIKEHAFGEAGNNQLVYVSWHTKAEINTSYFELQRSENGRDFYSIDIIVSNGLSGNNRYSTTDSRYNCYSDKLYYRLKVVFINGKVNFTEAIALDRHMIAPSVFDLTYNCNQQ